MRHYQNLPYPAFYKGYCFIKNYHQINRLEYCFYVNNILYLIDEIINLTPNLTLCYLLTEPNYLADI